MNFNGRNVIDQDLEVSIDRFLSDEDRRNRTEDFDYFLELEEMRREDERFEKKHY